MSSIESALFDCALADLVYTGPLDPADQRDYLDLATRRLTASLASRVVERFTLLDFVEDESSGFAAAIFKDGNSKQLYVALRGTEPSLADVSADIDLALGSGLASKQAVFMANWWREVSLRPGTAFTEVKRTPQGAITTGAQRTATGGAGGLVADALAQGGGRAVVTGHSLGGHLTTVFASVFSAQTLRRSTFNGAGIRSIGSGLSSPSVMERVARLLSGDPLQQLATALGTGLQVPDSARQANYYAVNGVNLTTNDWSFQQVGARIGVFNEESATVVGNHFLYKLTDALTLFEAVQRLDPSLSLAALNALASAGSNEGPLVSDERSLEDVLDGMRKLFEGPGVAPTPAGDGGGDWKEPPIPEPRESYHKNIAALLEATKNSGASYRFRLAFDASLARTDFAALASMALGTTFQASAQSIAAMDALGQVHTALYANWNADSNSMLARKNADSLNFTDAWLADRGAMLGAVVAKNIRNESYDMGALGDGLSPQTAYIDLATNIALTTGVAGLKQVVFDSEGADTVSGQGLADRLYGGGGNDDIAGGAGADRLEGQAGDDTRDGGQDNDTYRFAAGSRDIVFDHDGLGTLMLNGAPLPALQELGEPSGRARTRPWCAAETIGETLA